MFLLRRAAARSLQSKSLAFQPSRSFISSSAIIPRAQPQIRQQWLQRRLYSDEAEKEKASPAEQESGETVTAEPSAETQQGIVEESVATPDVADAANTSTTAEENPLGAEPGDAAPEPESVTSGSSASTFDAVKEKASDALDAISGTASGVASAATNTARSAGFRVGDSEPSKILYVGNLFFDLTPERLKAQFERYGNVVNCKIVTDSSGLSKGFGYIEFDDQQDAARAIEELDQTELEGRRMAVQYHVRRMRTTERRAPANPPSKTLFIGNMSFQMSDKDLNDLFRQVTNVLDVRVAIDRRSGQPRGFAHADFTDVASAEKAKKVLENKVVYGRQLKIDFGLPSASARQQR